MKINEVTKIEHASLGRRFLAFFFDVVITIFVGLGVFIGVSNIVSSFDKVNQLKVNYNEIINESGIMRADEKDSNYLHFETYDDAVGKISNFYSTYLPKYTTEESKSNQWFNCFVLGLDDVDHSFSDELLDSRSSIVKAGKDIFEYVESSGTIDSSSIGIPKAFLQGAKSFNDISDDDQKMILNYFNSEEKGSVFYSCIEKIAEIPQLNEYYNSYILWNTTVPLIVGILISYSAFFFIIPLCLKNGKTIGKLVLKISVVSTSCYSVKKSQIVLRYLPQILLFVVVILFLGANILTISVASIAVISSYLMAIFKENHQSIHDIVASTYVVSDIDSLWFKNEEEENLALQERKTIVG